MTLQSLRKNAAALLLILLLVVTTVLATFWQLRQESDRPALATFSTDPQGGRALMLWAQALGYQTTADTLSVFAPPNDARLAFILEPQLPGISEAEWEPLEEWVERGGTLVLVGQGFGTALSLQPHNFNIQFRDETEDGVVQVRGNLFEKAPHRLQNARPRAYLESERSDFETLLTIDGDPLVVMLAQGQGKMIFGSIPYPLSNLGLKEPGNAEFVLGMLQIAGEGGAIWFDEWHHGLRTSASTAPSGLGQWMIRSRPGQAILYAGLVLFLWLGLSGRRLGPSLPLPARQQRRAPAEHALALANLSRRAGHQQAVREHYRRSLKQALGERYGLSLALPDQEFVQRLAIFRPHLNVEELDALLAALRRDDLSESQMLRLAQETTTWINR